MTRSKHKNTIVYCFLIVFQLTIGSYLLRGQDLVFSQYFNVPMSINPAFAGLSNSPQFTLNYRNQWPSVSNAYITYGASYNQYIDKIGGGLGLMLINDESGDGTFSRLQSSLMYMYQVNLENDWQMKIGLEAQFNQMRLDWDKLIFLDQIDPVFGLTDNLGNPIASLEQQPDDLTNRFMDVSAGFLLYNEDYFVGLSLKHLNNPSYGFLSNSENNGLPILFSFQAGYRYVLQEGNNRNPGSFLYPQLLFAKQKDFTQVDIGAYAQLNRFIVGGLFRHTITNQDALILTTGLNIENFRITYSYDVTLSRLSNSTGGAHELGLIYRIQNQRFSGQNHVDCFDFYR